VHDLRVIERDGGVLRTERVIRAAADAENLSRNFSERQPAAADPLQEKTQRTLR
jgi:hypothetical protein